MFDPKTTKYPYTQKTDGHYIIIKKDDKTVFDGDYPYIDTSAGFRFMRGVVRALLYLVVFPASYVRMGLRIKGKENLKKHRDTLNNGVISVCNHVHMWDYIAIMNAVKPRKPYLLVWAPNIRGENGKIVRLVGGIPIPDQRSGTKAYLKTVKNMLNDGGWLHVYSEGSMWEYYRPIRPFKHGAKINQVVVLKGRITYVGNTSVEVRVDTYLEELVTGERFAINHAYLICVHINDDGRPLPIRYGLDIQTEEEQAEWDGAIARAKSRKERYTY